MNFTVLQMNLKEQGRLLRQDNFTVWNGKKKHQRRVFLQDDLVIFSKVRKQPGGVDLYYYKNSLKVSTTDLTTNLVVSLINRYFHLKTMSALFWAQTCCSISWIVESAFFSIVRKRQQNSNGSIFYLTYVVRYASSIHCSTSLQFLRCLMLLIIWKQTDFLILAEFTTHRYI